IKRISPSPANRPPIVSLTATPQFGAAPLAVDFDATLSKDPEGTPLTFEWDLDDDGQFDDATGDFADWIYQTPGNVTARVRVTAEGGASTTASAVTGVGNHPPVPVISGPSDSFRWHVGEDVPFAGSATDTEDGALGGASLTWTVKVKHCPSTCHTHPAFWT